MSAFVSLVKRNCKIFFKDKGMFFTSLITPAILLVLYVTFLGNVYRDSFTASLNGLIELDEKLINGVVGGELVSSLLAVSSVTVAFCSNLLMVYDKVSGAKKDLTMTPLKKSTLALSYYVATVISTLIVNFIALGISLIYLSAVGWYLSFADIMLLIVDIILLVLFGSALSSIINIFLTSQGQISAVGTIVSAGYGFICGAYMPISSFSDGLQKVVSCLPGTYGTSLVRNHSLNGTFKALSKEGIPDDVLEKIKDSIDCNLYFFENKIDILGMYAILGTSVLVLIGIYVLINIYKKD